MIAGAELVRDRNTICRMFQDVGLVDKEGDLFCLYKTVIAIPANKQ